MLLLHNILYRFPLDNSICKLKTTVTSMMSDKDQQRSKEPGRTKNVNVNFQKQKDNLYIKSCYYNNLNIDNKM